MLHPKSDFDYSDHPASVVGFDDVIDFYYTFDSFSKTNLHTILVSDFEVMLVTLALNTFVKICQPFGFHFYACYYVTLPIPGVVMLDVLALNTIVKIWQPF